MEVIVGNVIYVLADSGQYIRLDRIDNVHIRDSKIKCYARGYLLDLTTTLTEPTLSEKLEVVKSAQAKYTPVLQLCTRYAYTDEKKMYKGTHSTINAATSDPNWAIIKYTYTGSVVTMEQGPLVGSWDNRASLAWS